MTIKQFSQEWIRWWKYRKSHVLFWHSILSLFATQYSGYQEVAVNHMGLSQWLLLTTTKPQNW